VDVRSTLLVLALLLAVPAHAIRVLDLIYFTRGSDQVKKESMPIIEAVAQTMNGAPEIKRVAVIGNASLDDAPNDMERFNLSVRRAREVIDALQSHGVDRGRLVLLAAGSDKPRDTGKGQLAMQKNRRIEFLILERHE